MRSQKHIENAIEQVKQGILFDAPQMTLPAYKILFKAGAESVPPLLRELNRINLADRERPEVATLAVAFATLLHDLSETESAAFIEQVPIDECHPVVAAGFRRILKFSTTHFHRAKIGHVEILAQKSIDFRYRASAHVARWLGKVDRERLDELARVYVIESMPSHDFYGFYLAHVGVITITWDTSLHPWLPLQWPLRFLHEETLYHEIGHHFLRHHEPGQDPEQEDEAMQFATEQIRQSHPWLDFLHKLIAPLIHAWKRHQHTKSPDGP